MSDAGSDLDGWFAPVPRSDAMGAQTALALVTDPRAAVASTLVLQEMGYTVDFGAEPAYALRWLRRARYDLVLAGGEGVATTAFARRLRQAAPLARVLLMAERPLEEADLGASGIEVLWLPMDVNTLVRRLLPAPA